MALRASTLKIRPLMTTAVRTMNTGDWGSGSGKGGGSGGSIRDAGGAFGKIEAAREEEYFRKLSKVQLDDFKKHFDTEIKFHEEQIKIHQDAIARNKAVLQGAQAQSGKK
ncbi:hypothetical protein BV898_13416 [Hypsibius exemplaris]|uniref:ATP synthase F1 subunit epsilon n=1 Tax=Hypsibius exemplaris TaxID=2072580 RepID=A0A1W0WAR8_HYPEX|nr:hypothetical protein BV898_13416 [Hypsibius exemplaris]